MRNSSLYVQWESLLVCQLNLTLFFPTVQVSSTFSLGRHLSWWRCREGIADWAISRRVSFTSRSSWRRFLPYWQRGSLLHACSLLPLKFSQAEWRLQEHISMDTINRREDLRWVSSLDSSHNAYSFTAESDALKQQICTTRCLNASLSVCVNDGNALTESTEGGHRANV